MNVIIAGGRRFSDYMLLSRECDTLLSGIDVQHVISGTQIGADLLGERYAKERGYKVLRFPPDWTLGKAGGPVRNRKMAWAADVAIVFWDGKSKGAANMISEMKRINRTCHVIRYEVAPTGGPS